MSEIRQVGWYAELLNADGSTTIIPMPKDYPEEHVVSVTHITEIDKLQYTEDRNLMRRLAGTSGTAV